MHLHFVHLSSVCLSSQYDHLPVTQFTGQFQNLCPVGYLYVAFTQIKYGEQENLHQSKHFNQGRVTTGPQAFMPQLDTASRLIFEKYEKCVVFGIESVIIEYFGHQMAPQMQMSPCTYFQRLFPP